MAKEEPEEEEMVIGKNSTEALAFLASLDPSNFPSTTTIVTTEEITVPGYILEYFLDFIRKLYVKAKRDTGDEAPLSSGLPLTPYEEKLNTLLKGLEERDDDYFTKVPFPLTTIRAEKDPLSVAGETPLPDLLQELFLEVASQFVQQTSSLSTPDTSLDSISTKSISSNSSDSSLSVSSDSSAGSADTVTRTSIALGYTQPNLERLRKIIRACILKSQSRTRLVSASSSSMLSQISVIELMPPVSTDEFSESHSSKSPAGGSTPSEVSEARPTQPETKITSPATVSEKDESVTVPIEEESSSSLVKVDMLTSEPSIADMSAIEMNKLAVEVYMTRFYTPRQRRDSATLSFVQKLLQHSKLDSGVDFSGLKGAKDDLGETIDIYKFSNEQIKTMRSRANKNFQLMIKAKNLRDLKCLKRIKDSGKVITLRAI